MTAHDIILTERRHSEARGGPADPVARVEFENVPWAELRGEVLDRGFSTDAGPCAWASLLGAAADSDGWWERAVSEYGHYRGQFERQMPGQRTAPIAPIQGILNVSEPDVLRTDRALPEYRRDDSPVADLLRHDEIYNHDAGYVQA
jgi:hypothetical protein